ncbi:MAG: hypothetical protein AB8G16_13435 [Gammaproteobacteria bacterium]
MKHIWTVALLLVVAGCSKHSGSVPANTASTVSPGAAPEFVILEYDPWRMLVGSDSPTFALYANREVISRAQSGYRSAVLSVPQYEGLQSELDTVARFSKFEETYILTAATDQVLTRVLSFESGESSGVDVYGSLRVEELRQHAPRSLISMFDVATNFENSQSEEWVPEFIEVMIWPYKYASGASITWPPGWPQLDDPNTRQIRQRREVAYSIYLPGKHLAELKALLEQKKTPGAFEIGGKKWALNYRFPFPGESRWMQASTK